MPRAIGFALLSAALFGASTPVAKLLTREVSPLMLAGILYLGSGLGLLLWLALRRTMMRAERITPLARVDLPWIGAATAAGGITGPALLMFGLLRTDAASASLLLNLEASSPRSLPGSRSARTSTGAYSSGCWRSSRAELCFHGSRPQARADLPVRS
jgi:hypothetical protein